MINFKELYYDFKKELFDKIKNEKIQITYQNMEYLNHTIIGILSKYNLENQVEIEIIQSMYDCNKLILVYGNLYGEMLIYILDRHNELSKFFDLNMKYTSSLCNNCQSKLLDIMQEVLNG
jgi:hypothetical protein